MSESPRVERVTKFRMISMSADGTRAQVIADGQTRHLHFQNGAWWGVPLGVAQHGLRREVREWQTWRRDPHPGKRVVAVPQFARFERADNPRVELIRAVAA